MINNTNDSTNVSGENEVLRKIIQCLMETFSEKDNIKRNEAEKILAKHEDEFGLLLSRIIAILIDKEGLFNLNSK